MIPTKKIWWIVLTLILLLSAGLRLYHLGTEDLWVDEIYTIQTAQIPLFAVNIFNLEPRDFLHFVYDFIIMHFWLKLGTDAATIRLFSALVGIATISLLFLIGKRLFDTKIGLMSALFLALSSYHIYYSQEACAYALQLFLILGMVYYFIRGFEEKKISLWIIFTILTILGIAVREFTILTWLGLTSYAVLSIIFLKRKPSRIGLWFGSQMLILLLCAFGLYLYFNRAGAIFYGNWLSKPAVHDIGDTFNYFSLGWVHWTLPNMFQKSIVPLFIFSLLLSLITISKSENIKITLDRNTNLILSWCLFIIPFSLFYFISFKKPIFVAYRYLIIILPFFYLLVAYGLSKIPTKFIRYPLLAILIFGMVVGTIIYHQSVKKIPWSKIAAKIDRNAVSTDSILIYEEYWKSGLQYYQNSSIPIQPIYLWKDLSEYFQDLTKGYNRIWLITVTFPEKKPVKDIDAELMKLFHNKHPILLRHIKQPGDATVELSLFSN